MTTVAFNLVLIWWVKTSLQPMTLFLQKYV